jgi:hypothetical protein
MQQAIWVSGEKAYEVFFVGSTKSFEHNSEKQIVFQLLQNTSHMLYNTQKPVEP